MKNLIIGGIIISAIGGSLIYFLAGDSLQKTFRYMTSESQQKTKINSTPPSISSFKTASNLKTDSYIGNGNLPAKVQTVSSKSAESSKQSTEPTNSNGPQRPGTGTRQNVSQTNSSNSSSPEYLNYRCMSCGKITPLKNDTHTEICRYCKSRDLIELPVNTGVTPAILLHDAVGIAVQNTELYNRTVRQRMESITRQAQE